MDTIIMRRLVFEALQDYNSYSDKTMNGPEMKTVGNLFEYIEDKIYTVLQKSVWMLNL